MHTALTGTLFLLTSQPMGSNDETVPKQKVKYYLNNIPKDISPQEASYIKSNYSQYYKDYNIGNRINYSKRGFDKNKTDLEVIDAYGDKKQKEENARILGTIVGGLAEPYITSGTKKIISSGVKGFESKISPMLKNPFKPTTVEKMTEPKSGMQLKLNLQLFSSKGENNGFKKGTESTVRNSGKTEIKNNNWKFNSEIPKTAIKNSDGNYGLGRGSEWNFNTRYKTPYIETGNKGQGLVSVPSYNAVTNDYSRNYDVFYRTISEKHYKSLLKSGNLPPSGETSIAEKAEYSIVRRGHFNGEYKPSPKHKGPKMPPNASPDSIPDIKTGNDLLKNHSYNSATKKQRFAIYKGKMIKFQPTGTNNEWHAYELNDKQIKSQQVPTDVLKQMLKDGVITKAQYNKWH